MEENERTHCENNAHMRNFAHVHCGNDRVRVCRPNFSEVAGQTRTKQKACLQFQPLATSTEEEKEEVGVEEESLVPQSQGEESKEEGDDQYIEDNVFAHKLTKRSYPSNNYDLKGSAVTQTLRSARDISGASDEEPHTCSTWGHGAFKTFTDEFYYFTSNCNYILSRHCKDDTEDFNVEIRRDLAGNLEHIFMKIDGALIVVANGTIKVKHKVVSLPYNDRLINIQEYGVDVRFTNKMHTISLIWDYNNELSLTVDVQYHGKLCGLCGPFDESISTTYDLEFTLQSNLDTGGICKTEFPDEAACESNDMCSKIPNVFAMCSSSVNNNKFMKMCQMDACACKGAPQCHCSTFKKASKQCTHVNPSLWHTWRDSNQCPLPICPGNQVYQECGPACMPTCTDPNSQQQCDQCINTCGCQAGTVLDTLRGDNKCIKQMDCPCEYDGKIYSSGETRNSFCQSCICQGGKWECTKLDCPETCKIEEGTHITTFDGTYYNLIGDCSYHAIVTKDWSVKIEMHPCQEAHGQTCLQKVSYVKNQDVYTINYDGTVQLNGNKIELPVGNGLIAIFEQSSFYIQVHVRFELKMQIQISPIMQLCISLPRNALRSTKGLCGTFNDNAKDDFLSAQNIVEPAFITFSDSWKENEGCPSPKVNPICVSSENGNFAKEHCAYLKDPAGAFSICHSTVEFNKYYEMCKVASCSCQKVNDCVCGALGAYVHACAAKGIIVKNWRRSVCRVNCPPTQVYHHDVRSCNHTCRFLSTPDFTCELHDVPVDGCGCPEGTYMNEKKRCVNKSECPCYVDGLIRQKGELITVNGMNCYCNNGVPSCPNTINPPILQDCRKQNKIVSDCANTDVCKKTCATLNKPCPNPCVPGCVCPSGFVEDSSGKCILPSQCPCLFGGETFIPGAIISNDCNKCTCEGGAWQCTNNACPKTCQVYGDGHYITFDGKRYSFDGNCEYIFVEDQCLGDIGTFQILTESVPCCENGVTCSRNIRILFEDKEIILLSGSGVSEISLRKNQCTDNSYKIHTVGLYLVITFSNGITVIWDKRTRFSVTLDTRWKNKVCGLCGNFNNELEDELTTKENSLVASFLEFGNSWKSMQSCSDTVNQTFPCDKNPYCLAWAQRRCHIITGAIFQACHKMVDPTPYYDACVQEACACDMEGKYLSFCTAVAVYAEACNKADVCIRWRTPDLCPVYCDYYNTPGECSWHYQPCGTITTKTCSGHFIGKKYAAVLEGCYAKCPEKAPYLDENTMKCVTLPQCTCYYDGRILQPGETTMNDCEECMCKDGITTCQRLTTTTVPSTTLLTTTLLTSTSTISSTITSTEETTTMVTPSTSPSTTEETSTPTSTAETTTTSTTEETTTPTITTEKTNPQTTTAESTTSYTSEKTTKPTTEATTSTTPEVVTTTVSTSTTPYYTGKTTTEATSTESTSSSTTKQTTSPEKTTTESTTSYTSEKTTKPTTEAITSTTPEEVTTTVSTSTTPYYMAKTTTEATSTESTSSSTTSE
ncbi:mucin-19-like [Narcine bancroftii]|uniref:mucin-19-like n=1 Tax=Narcine bancroftii TaxID=1343680 RepID=UPI0038321A10